MDKDFYLFILGVFSILLVIFGLMVAIVHHHIWMGVALPIGMLGLWLTIRLEKR
jgi:hypothetical protein